MSFLYENATAVYIAFVISAVSWLFGGTRAELLLPVAPYLVLFMFEMMLCFPQRRSGESLYGARRRVWKAMRRDPLVWTALGFMLLLSVPFVNNGLCRICDYERITLGMNPEPPVGFLPFCVDRIHHLNVFLWFALAFSSMVAARHALGRRGKRLLLEMVVWNGAALALLGFVQSAAGAPGPLWAQLAEGVKAGDFFSTFGYPNMAGDYFTTVFALAVASWRRRCDEVTEELLLDSENADGRKRRGIFWRKHFFLLPASVCYFAALNTLSRASIMLATVLAVVFFLHAFISFTAKKSKASRIKIGVWSAVALGVLVFFSTVFMPENIRREVDTLDTAAVLDRVTGKGQYHVRVATEIWKEYPLFGCGGWGYRHFCIPKMTEAEYKDIQRVGGINVHNDYLQFLAEHGAVGFGAILAVFIMLCLPVVKAWSALIKATRFAKPKDLPPRPVQLFVMPAPVFTISLAVVATIVHGFGDCPLRSPAVLTLFFVSLAAADGYLPKLNLKKE
jgi:O-antigen ligase